MEKIKPVIKKHGTEIKKWIKGNPKEAILIIAIIILAAFLRLYRISEYMTFLGDEGRDAIVVRRLLVYGDPILIGPGTSIGNMYLGPLYYYLIAPALLLANFSPAGPSVFVALIGVATVWLVYYVGKEWFPTSPRLRGASGKINIAALIAAGLYAISPVVIIYSRSSWNPNIMPFFSLLSVYLIWRVWKHKEFKWFIVLGISYAFVLQSHYLGLLLAPTLILFWFLSLRNLKLIGNCLPAGKAGKLPARRQGGEIGKFLQKSLLGFVIFASLMSPLVIFDARHGWRNFTAMEKFFSERQQTVSVKPWSAIPKIPVLFTQVNTSLISAKNKNVGLVVSLLIAITTLIYINVVKKNKAFWLVFSWAGFGLLGLGLYKQEIYDHYYGFFFPASFLLLGFILNIFFQEKWKIILKIFPAIIFLVLLVINIKNSPLINSPQRQMQRAQKVAQKIMQEAKGEQFNLAVLAERNYEDGYQYFLEKDGAKVVDIDAQRISVTMTDQLFAVCELPKEKCDPTHSPKAEVANFGWSKIENEWEVMGTRIFKLVHAVN